MTAPYFPADVSLRIEGNDTAGAQALIPAAANLLYKALALQRNGNKSHVRLLLPGGDGSLIQVFLAGNLKQVYLRPGPVSEEVVSEETPPVIEAVKTYINDMLSGVVRPGAGDDFATVDTIANPDDDDPPVVPALNQFHPDRVTADAYLLNYDWQEPPRLGVDDTGNGIDGNQANSHYPKPGMYSGAMKRVVSAVLGVGRTTTETADYISDELPASYPDYVAWNQYDYTWLRTHGVLKADDGSVWLIEVSKLNGVCAMPLPVFDGTAEAGYMEWLASYGDTDTMAIVLEFGGLPTGEPFPEGSDLTDAIANGKVVQLLAPDDIEDFYVDTVVPRAKNTYFADCGWAFSDSGKKACNTCRWYSRPDIIGPPPLPPGYPWPAWDTNDYFNDVVLVDGYRFADPMDRYMRTELWELEINVVRNIEGGVDAPVGIGSAELTRLEATYIAHQHDRAAFGGESGGIFLEDGFAYEWTLPPWFLPIGDTESLQHIPVRCFGRPAADAVDATDWANSANAPVLAFYIGERREVVRYTAYYPGLNAGRAPGFFTSDSILLGTSTSGTSFSNPYDTPGSFDVGLFVPAFNREAYALVKFTYPSTLGGTEGDLQTYLLLPDTARILTDPDIATQPVRNFGDPTFPILSWLYAWCGYHPLDTEIIKFAAVINTGPSDAWVISDGVLTNNDTLHYVQSTTLASYLVPVDTPARGITFVGSVSDDS